MLEIVALTSGGRRFQKVTAAIIHRSRDCPALETPFAPVPFSHIQGERGSNEGTRFERKRV